MEVCEAVATISAGPMRSTEVGGRGAAGDKTLVADRRAEEVLAKSLLGVEGVKILSEEAGEIGDPMSPILAVVDPLDGSSNFERGIQFYCTSIAVAEGEGERLEDVKVALVRNLVNGDLYFAAKGKGATKNGKRISSSSRRGSRASSRTAVGTRANPLSEAVLAVDLSGCSGALLKTLTPLVSGAKRVVHFGANALELCLLAEGTIDGFVDLRGRMRITDIAGGYLIAREAGAQIALSTSWNAHSQSGAEAKDSVELSLGLRFSMVASANPSIHESLVSALRRAHLGLKNR